jgi:SnoaL-like domain
MSTKGLESNVQYMLDRFEIQDVLARYAAGQDDHQGIESGTLEDWANVFTLDAVLDYTQAGAHFAEKCSYQRLAEIMRGDQEQGGLMSGSFHKWQHMLGLPLVEIDGDTAKARTDLFATHVGQTNVGTPWHLFDGCVFHDELVRTDQGWRIRARRLEVHYVEIVETLQPGKQVEGLIGQA